MRIQPLRGAPHVAHGSEAALAFTDTRLMTESSGFGERNTISIARKDWKAFLNPNRQLGGRRYCGGRPEHSNAIWPRRPYWPAPAQPAGTRLPWSRRNYNASAKRARRET